MAYELKFDPKTIEHLGVKMYSTLPPALGEIISNAYDADADKVELNFHEQNQTPKSITIKDDGYGMSSDDIQTKFLVIGRNRRSSDGDIPTRKHRRLPTGKKGLGKLALFGLAKVITVDTIKDGLRNRFVLEWDNLLSADGVYSPKVEISDEKTSKENGTTIKLSELKRKTPFDLEGIADSLSKMFIIDSSFSIVLKSTNGKELLVDNDRKYKQIEEQFSWDENDLIPQESMYRDKIQLRLITAKTPISPSSGLRGITLFSRGKLVNAPEYFASSTSSHFFQYLTGWIKADFIDLLDEDVISTNRQAINWDHPEMEQLRAFLSDLIMQVGREWRKKREVKKNEDFTVSTGIDKEKWLSTMPKDVRRPLQKIVDTMTKDEEVSETYLPVISALYEIVPEYPDLHWRHLHEEIRERIKPYYSNNQFAEAADQGTKIYAQLLRKMSGVNKDGTDLASVFNGKPPKIKIADISTDSGWNIQEGQSHMTRGVMAGFRNPMNHEPFDVLVPGTFSQLDCLNILSLISYLTTRLDHAIDTEAENS
ncbi:TIGR02391 family protein [Vibrio cholerae]|uniref:TIGR02391 family protein n=1 Tax=Vibrio cholerae TaxID=666 RepID=UPI00215C16C1|nr:TIGR02391 family protein [Vibrio cholerae]MCR9870964.1 TIGR02391 family protein [Vibrio cholerae]